MTIKLESLQGNKGSRRKKMRKGRGIAAGQGASCGFGMRGQKSRSGRPTRPGFEGGQMPLYRRLPKRGFKSLKKKDIGIINLLEIQKFIETKKIKSNDELNIKLLKEKRILKKDLNFLKILGKGEIKEKLKVSTNFISKSAKSKIEKAGGTITILQKKIK